jgi:hypothetical protein
MRSISGSWSPSSRGDGVEVVEQVGEAKDAVVFATARGVVGAVHPETRRNTFTEEEDLHVPTIYRVEDLNYDRRLGVESERPSDFEVLIETGYEVDLRLSDC